MIDKISQFIHAESLLPAGAEVLVGVSGGLDSITLVFILHALGYDVTAAHVNYGLRGLDSDADELHVQQFCDRVGVPLVVHRETPIGSGSVQEKARLIRYRFFESVAAEAGLFHVAVAHNKNDQAETVLLNLHRGSGLDGLAGMNPSRRLSRNSTIQLVRPLLPVRRSDLEAFARTRELMWREDASNEDCTFKRVHVRRNVLPALDELAETDVVDDLAALASELQTFTDHVLPAVLPEALSGPWPPNRSKRLEVDALTSLDPAVRAWFVLKRVKEWLPGAPVRSTTVTSIDQLLHASSGKKIVFGSHTIWRERNHLRFIPADEMNGRSHRMEERESEGTIAGDFGVISWEDGLVSNDFLSADKQTICIDFEKIEGMMTVRPWRPGDRFQPFGMRGTKKVKSFLTDEGVSSAQKRDVHVLCEGDKIVWVIGYRMDDRYRIDEHTKRVRRFTVQGPS